MPIKTRKKSINVNVAEPRKRIIIKKSQNEARINLTAEPPQSTSVAQRVPQLNIYRKIAYSFIILTIALLAVIFYFSFIKVTIIIDPDEERINNNLIVDIIDKNKNDISSTQNKGTVSGLIESLEVEQIRNYPSTGIEVIGEETTGTVTIINNYTKNQPLVATTRLLSTDDKLFRIKNTVNVPAGGSVEVEVYADEAGPLTAIGPTKFTIPGLWAGLQDKIYAESKETFIYNEKAKKHVTQLDIDNGIVDLRKNLLKKAEQTIGETYKNYNQTIYKIDENSVTIEVDGKVEEERNEFSITIKAAVAVIAFDDEKIKKMAHDKLTSVISSDKELIKFNEDEIVYNLDNYNLEDGVATINMTFDGLMAPMSGDDIIDREKILGLTREQLNDFLINEAKIENYEVKFSPAFIDKVPNLVDRIKIRIKN